MRVPHPDQVDIELPELNGDHRLVSLGLAYSFGPVPDLVARDAAGRQLVVMGRHTRVVATGTVFTNRFVSGNLQRLKDIYPESFEKVTAFTGIDELDPPAMFGPFLPGEEPATPATDLYNESISAVFKASTQKGPNEEDPVEIALELFADEDSPAALQELAAMPIFVEGLRQATDTLHILAAVPCKAGDWITLTVEQTEPNFEYSRHDTAPVTRASMRLTHEFVIDRPTPRAEEDEGETAPDETTEPEADASDARVDALGLTESLVDEQAIGPGVADAEKTAEEPAADISEAAESLEQAAQRLDAAADELIQQTVAAEEVIQALSQATSSLARVSTGVQRLEQFGDTIPPPSASQHDQDDWRFAALRPTAHLIRTLLRFFGLAPVATVRWEPMVQHSSSLHYIVNAPAGCELEDVFWERLKDRSRVPDNFRRGATVRLSTHVADASIDGGRLWMGLMIKRTRSLRWTGSILVLLAVAAYRLSSEITAHIPPAAVMSNAELGLLVAAGGVLANTARAYSTEISRRIAPGLVALLWLSSGAPTALAASAAFEFGSGKFVQLMLKGAVFMFLLTAWLVAGTHFVRIWPRWRSGVEPLAEEQVVTSRRLRFYRRRDGFGTALLAVPCLCAVVMSVRLL